MASAAKRGRSSGALFKEITLSSDTIHRLNDRAQVGTEFDLRFLDSLRQATAAGNNFFIPKSILSGRK
jgi:hypothetical protein